MGEEIRKAVETLQKGGVLLYPTDTVWGIGCDATSSEAVARVFRIKAREDSKSLVLLAGDIDMVARYVSEIPEVALQ
ncbi:MAG: Sua5/YciO/YrdC/YwlC family protein, partial [Bacteroidales bacterium]|nr:Sua5/YciO/YrdC/YwlC family protein [Bacteroidales bacterium]